MAEPGQLCIFYDIQLRTDTLWVLKWFIITVQGSVRPLTLEILSWLSDMEQTFGSSTVSSTLRGTPAVSVFTSSWYSGFWGCTKVLEMTWIKSSLCSAGLQIIWAAGLSSCFSVCREEICCRRSAGVWLAVKKKKKMCYGLLETAVEGERWYACSSKGEQLQHKGLVAAYQGMKLIALPVSGCLEVLGHCWNPRRRPKSSGLLFGLQLMTVYCWDNLNPCCCWAKLRASI